MGLRVHVTECPCVCARVCGGSELIRLAPEVETRLQNSGDQTGADSVLGSGVSWRCLCWDQATSAYTGEFPAGQRGEQGGGSEGPAPRGPGL